MFSLQTPSDVALYPDLEFEAFLPNPSNKLKRLRAKNCPVQALKIYWHHTELMRKSSCMFVCYSARAHGKQASKRVVSGWMASVIMRAYAAMGREIPRVNPHTI